jgi:hypothetical protein
MLAFVNCAGNLQRPPPRRDMRVAPGSTAAELVAFDPDCGAAFAAYGG